MLEYYNMWMKQYFDTLEFMNVKMEVKKEKVYSVLKTNDYVPFKDNGLSDIVRSWTKTK